MSKNPTEFTTIDAIKNRWSPYVLSSESVSLDDLRGLFDAARWAASSYNEQPWRYIVARREDTAAFETMVSCLIEANQAWAKNAAVLALGVASTTFQRNGNPNGVALHDLGAASAHLALEATARGLVVHQMAGILPDRIREVYGVPEDFQPYTALAIGRAGDPDADPKFGKRDQGERTRNAFESFVFAERWDAAAQL